MGSLRASAAALAFGVVLGWGPQGPLGVLPGGPLAGEVVAEPVSDWGFAAEEQYAALENPS